jgi:hypothetical protein
MVPVSVLITQPSVDFQTLLAVSHQALGYSIAKSSDESRREQHPAERFLSCLDSLRDQHAPAGLTPDLLTHVSFSVLIIADEFDTLDILQCAAGLPFVSTPTQARGAQLTLVSGTLAQWRDAVVSGTRKSGAVQIVYCQIMSHFEAFNLNPWSDFNKKWSGDRRLFLLEDKRK